MQPNPYTLRRFENPTERRTETPVNATTVALSQPTYAPINSSVLGPLSSLQKRNRVSSDNFGKAFLVRRPTEMSARDRSDGATNAAAAYEGFGGRLTQLLSYWPVHGYNSTTNSALHEEPDRLTDFTRMPNEIIEAFAAELPSVYDLRALSLTCRSAYDATQPLHAAIKISLQALTSKDIEVAAKALSELNAEPATKNFIPLFEKLRREIYKHLINGAPRQFDFHNHKCDPTLKVYLEKVVFFTETLPVQIKYEIFCLLSKRITLSSRSLSPQNLLKDNFHRLMRDSATTRSPILEEKIKKELVILNQAARFMFDIDYLQKSEDLTVKNEVGVNAAISLVKSLPLGLTYRGADYICHTVLDFPADAYSFYNNGRNIAKQLETLNFENKEKFIDNLRSECRRTWFKSNEYRRHETITDDCEAVRKG